ncbi:ATP-binding protein [Aggregicoccus sp. 17bor-14]|uniref:hybrid sensor histidine kinase/response regulator n=1 Tax=Myxococcaceae TaxID=31 RepID=UPI00351A5EF7
MFLRPASVQPLRLHLLRLVVGVLLPAVAFAGLLVFQLAGAERAAVERRVQGSARALTEAFDREMSGSIRTLQALAQSSHLERGELEAFHAECQRVLRTQPTWRSVALATPDARTLAHTAAAWGEPMPPVVERESFERAVAAGAPLVGSLARGPKSGLAFPIRVPVLHEGRVRFVLTAVVTPETLTDVASRQVDANVEWTRTLVDLHGTVAARTRDPQRYVGHPASPQFLQNTRQGREGVYAGTSLDGEPVYVAYSRASPSGWTAAVVVPRAVMEGPLRNSLLALGGLGLSLLVLSGAAAWLISRRLERSLLGAAAAAEALAQGSAPVLGRTRVLEVQRLGAALQHSARLLEQRERERDAHLQAAEAARAEAVAATQAKDAFLAMLGHELRNPLAPIVSSLEALRLRGLGGSPEHEVISRQLRHVVRMVDDLLDVARIRRGQLSLSMHKQPLELASAVAKACESAAPLVEQRHHALEVQVPAQGLRVLGDPVRLTQVVANLLVNAARYTPPGGHLRVRAEAQGDEVLLEVQDDGQGLSEELAARVFEPFVQGARGFDQSAGGLGIGLALVRSLVQAHGGRVQAQSAGPGRGSTFRVWLPRLAAGGEPAAAPAPARDETGAPRLRILVVDDNVDAASALGDLLELGGHQVRVAHDAQGALRAVEGFSPQVAILDVGLPEVDGYALARRLREHLGAAPPAFAALTGFGQGEDRRRSTAEGFQRHFVKPVRLQELEAFFRELRAAA